VVLVQVISPGVGHGPSVFCGAAEGRRKRRGSRKGRGSMVSCIFFLLEDRRSAVR
jgi:hypothetical protein